MDSNQNNFPAFPTFPMPNNLGQMVSFAGLTKVEYMAAHLASGWWQHSNTLPEVIASEAIQIAREILKQCNESPEEKKEKQSKIIQLEK
jgi:hypothetical protein